VFRNFKLLAAAAMSVALLAVNLGVASAHQWCGSWPNGCYHWDKSGSHIVIQNYNYAGNWQAAENARQDGWNKISILYNYSVNYHTDISVFDGNFGATGWAGLATLESVDFDWGCLCYRHIAHAHARYNTYYGGSQQYIQGVFCQEIAHGWGLDHSNTGDCMGLGYYPGSTDYYGPHNNTDFYNIYRFH
jgi:predicted Zn-dependent protease